MSVPVSSTSSAPTPLGSRPLLATPVDKLLGKRTAEQLGRQGVETAGDLLRLLPRRYDTWGDLTDLSSLVEGEQVTVQAQVMRSAARRARGGRPPALMEALVTDGASKMDVVFFGAAGLMAHYAEQFSPGTTVLLSGKVGIRRGHRQLASPRFQVLDELDEAERAELLARPMPIYPATESLPSWRVAKAVRTVLDQLTEQDVPEPLPPEVRQAHDLVGALTAWRWVHTPEDAEQWRAARKRLRYEEAFVLQSALVQRRAAHEATHAAVAWPRPGAGSLRASLDASLPYTLTRGQERVGRELEEALASMVPMQTLLQGDVGSGKTLVALRAMLQVVGGGGQAALLAPTEVLAAQHRSSLEQLLGPLARAGMLGGASQATQVLLLTGSTPTPQRREILARLAAGESAIVVGTHALLSDTVQIPFLGLVVVDEQHRFGVAQRDALRERGNVRDPDTGQLRTPHLLVMTATPIPRTIAMTVFGDLDTAVLDELPAGRSPVATHLVPWERTGWVEGIWQRAAREVAQGGRVYVVCPRIDSGEADPGDGADDPQASASRGGTVPLFAAVPGAGDEAADEESAPARPLASVEDWVERLRGEPALAGVSIGTLTGRMSQADKDAVMADFARGRTPVLVSTTVIEVGVDVPEATMMVILDADRFGLSQLHQLRGRVGRGQRESLCVAVTGVEVGSPAFHRLRAFAQTMDGFRLAEADLELRSEGNVLGAAQSGRRSDLDLLRVTRDGALIASARAEAEALVSADPHLADHRDLAAAIADRLDEESRAYLERA